MFTGAWLYRLHESLQLSLTKALCLTYQYRRHHEAGQASAWGQGRCLTSIWW